MGHTHLKTPETTPDPDKAPEVQEEKSDTPASAADEPGEGSPLPVESNKRLDQ